MGLDNRCPVVLKSRHSAEERADETGNAMYICRYESFDENFTIVTYIKFLEM